MGTSWRRGSTRTRALISSWFRRPATAPRPLKLPFSCSTNPLFSPVFPKNEGFFQSCWFFHWNLFLSFLLFRNLQISLSVGVFGRGLGNCSKLFVFAQWSIFLQKFYMVFFVAEIVILLLMHSHTVHMCRFFCYQCMELNCALSCK